MEELINETISEIARKMIELGKLSLEEIANICELPIEKVRELAAEKSSY